MIIVDDHVFEAPREEQTSTNQMQKWEILERLLTNSSLIASSENLKSKQLKTILGSMNEKIIYVYQGEFATAAPMHVELIGTDEATTCVCVAIRDVASGLTSVGHLDSARSASLNLDQMVNSFAAHICCDTFEVHLVGAYDEERDIVDSSLDRKCRNPAKRLHSHPLAAGIVDALYLSSYKFKIKTLCLLQHNTCVADTGYSRPIIGGFVVETGTGNIYPAKFDANSRGPDGLVRHLKLLFGRNMKGSLFEAYNTTLNKFFISPFKWRYEYVSYAADILALSDSEILANCSTSPHAESEDFVESTRSVYKYLVSFPDWRQTFPTPQPRVFTQSPNGGWIREL